MMLSEINAILDAKVLAGKDLLHTEIEMICAADLMSDVLAMAKPGALLLTGLTNAQVVRTAEMADLRAICFVRAKQPDVEAITMAEAKHIPLLRTKLPMYESCGRLFHTGLPGGSGQSAENLTGY